MAEVLMTHAFPYHEHFEWDLGYRGEKVLEELGLQCKPTPVVVGVVLATDSRAMRVALLDRYPWNAAAFSRLGETYDRIYKNHPLHTMMYGDEPSMRDKPENTRRDALRQAVAEVLAGTPEDPELVTLVGAPRPVDFVYVVPVLRVDRAFLDQSSFVLRRAIEHEPFIGYRSVAHAALDEVLRNATTALERPDPGRGLGNEPSSEELARRAVRSFMFTPTIAIKARPGSSELLERVNSVAGLLYESAKGVGNLLLVDSEHPKLRFDLKFIHPVPMRDAGWARKILQMATTGVSMVANYEEILGIGSMEPDYDPSRQEAFTIEFLDHHCWRLRCGDQVLLRSDHGRAYVPSSRISQDRFASNFRRIFPGAPSEGVDIVWEAFNQAMSRAGGSMIVVAVDAAAEAARLRSQGTPIHPARLTTDLLARATEIDGSILVDPSGACHAIGVILDGSATDACRPSRGSRYNSAVRYVESGAGGRLALVVSEDGTVDILPLLRPQVRRTEVEGWLSALEAATRDNYLAARNWIDDHRFYLDAGQCARANVALESLRQTPGDGLMILTTPLSPNPRMNPSYYLPEAAADGAF